MRECLPGTSFHQNSILLFPKCGDRTSQGHAKLLDSGTVREIGFRFLFNIVCLIQIIVLTTSFLSQRKRGRCRNSSRSGLWSKSHLPEFHKERVIWWDNVMITTKDICLGTVRRTVLVQPHVYSFGWLCLWPSSAVKTLRPLLRPHSQSIYKAPSEHPSTSPSSPKIKNQRWGMSAAFLKVEVTWLKVEKCPLWICDYKKCSNKKNWISRQTPWHIQNTTVLSYKSSAINVATPSQKCHKKYFCTTVLFICLSWTTSSFSWSGGWAAVNASGLYASWWGGDLDSCSVD